MATHKHGRGGGLVDDTAFVELSAYVAPTATVGARTYVGHGAYIAPGIVVGTDCVICDRVRVEANVTSGTTVTCDCCGDNASPYLGDPMLRSYQFDNPGTAFAILNVMSLSQHSMGDDVSAVQFAIANWAGFSEAGPGVASTVTGSIEFGGAFTQLRFAGAVTGSIPNGGMIWSDPVPWVIPRGVQFGVRLYRTNVAGTPFTLSVQDPGFGDRFEANVGVDKTMGGVITTTDPTNWAGPVGARAIMTRPSVAFLGDSIAFRALDVADGTGALGGIARSLQVAGLPWMNLALGSDQAQAFVANPHTNRVTLASLCSHMIVQYGINDIEIGGRTDAQLQSSLLAINALMPAGQKKFVATMVPRTLSSDGWTTLVNQTQPAFGPVVDANNAWRRTTPTGYEGHFDLNAVLRSGPANGGKWLVPGYTPDGLHPSAFAHALLQSSGVIPSSAFSR